MTIYIVMVLGYSEYQVWSLHKTEQGAKAELERVKRLGETGYLDEKELRP